MRGSGETLNTTTTTTNTTKASFSPAANMQRSPWHSPVPYLFGGLAAMLGLIAFALLILACSYWKLSGLMDNGGDGGERDLESGDDNKGSGETRKAQAVYEEKIVVIMAGDEKPRFLATPMSSRASSFGDCNGKSENKEREKAEKSEKQKEDMDNHEQTTIITTTAADETQERDTQENPEQNQ